MYGGRGRRHFHRLANQRFLELVKMSRKEYNDSRCKKMVARRIVKEWQSQHPPGRFLQQDPSTEKWYEIKEAKIMEKTCQALRDLKRERGPAGVKQGISERMVDPWEKMPYPMRAPPTALNGVMPHSQAMNGQVMVPPGSIPFHPSGAQWMNHPMYNPQTMMQVGMMQPQMPPPFMMQQQQPPPQKVPNSNAAPVATTTPYPSGMGQGNGASQGTLPPPAPTPNDTEKEPTVAPVPVPSPPQNDDTPSELKDEEKKNQSAEMSIEKEATIVQVVMKGETTTHPANEPESKSDSSAQTKPQSETPVHTKPMEEPNPVTDPEPTDAADGAAAMPPTDVPTALSTDPTSTPADAEEPPSSQPVTESSPMETDSKDTEKQGVASEEEPKANLDATKQDENPTEAPREDVGSEREETVHDAKKESKAEIPAEKKGEGPSTPSAPAAEETPAPTTDEEKEKSTGEKKDEANAATHEPAKEVEKTDSKGKGAKQKNELEAAALLANMFR